ncbi:hypothetical protein RRG08_011349 [Elysia crispata]|uniref:Uncharacterized protein n=1 Tax=Elysia crispata TaxID=231223 RepID=A0AAE0YHQ5_9GAST|nr:hypothetical protein RRG08_011349 [Elysia crispata]
MSPTRSRSALDLLRLQSVPGARLICYVSKPSPGALDLLYLQAVTGAHKICCLQSVPGARKICYVSNPSSESARFAVSNPSLERARFAMCQHWRPSTSDFATFPDSDPFGFLPNRKIKCCSKTLELPVGK